MEAAIAEGPRDEVCWYCKGDVVQLHAIRLRHQLMSGELSPAAYNASVASLAEAICARGLQGEHWADRVDAAEPEGSRRSAEHRAA